MITPPIPMDELQRLQSLRELKILDTDPEERFDRITRLAKKLFDVPIALVSLVDSSRQWFKSRQGIDLSETPRDISFCGHAINSEEVMVVGDSLADQRFCDNPLVTGGPNIRFYAGYPLRAPDGSRLGTLCILDHEPRNPNDVDTAALTELGEIIEEELAVASMMRNDTLTGLANQLGFLEIGQHILAVCSRTKASVTMLVVQLKNHLAIEASLSTDEADRAMIELSQLAMSVSRSSDLVARIESDTLAVLLIGASIEESGIVNDRIAQQIYQRNMADGNRYELDVDFFAAEWTNTRDLGIDVLLETAGQLMTGTEDLKALGVSASAG